MCCFRVYETYETRPAKKTVRNVPVIVRPSTTYHHQNNSSTSTMHTKTAFIPTAYVVPPAPPTPPASYPYPEFVYTAPPPPVVVEAPPPVFPIDTDSAAKKIADILAPESRFLKYEAEVADTQRELRALKNEKEKATFEKMQERYINDEAVRRVRERNRRYELQTSLEDQARLRVENDFRRRSGSHSGSSSRSRERSRERAERHRYRHSTGGLVVVEQQPQPDVLVVHQDQRTRCGNCRSYGHRTRDCDRELVVVVAGQEERRRRDIPRGRVNYVVGL